MVHIYKQMDLEQRDNVMNIFNEEYLYPMSHLDIEDWLPSKH